MNTPSLRCAVWVVCVALLACDTLEPNPDDIPLDEIIRLERARSPDPLLANGTDSDTFTAVLPRAASERQVGFSTTRGAFVVSGDKTVSHLAVPDSVSGTEMLIARAVLRTDTFPGVAIVSAMIKAFRDTLHIEFVQPSLTPSYRNSK